MIRPNSPHNYQLGGGAALFINLANLAMEIISIPAAYSAHTSRGKCSDQIVPHLHTRLLDIECNMKYPDEKGPRLVPAPLMTISKRIKIRIGLSSVNQGHNKNKAKEGSGAYLHSHFI